MNRFTKIASAVAVTAAIAVPSSQAFAATKTENALIGGAIGALAGALIGNGSTSAVVGGAAVGALVGVATDKPDHRYVASRPVYRSSYQSSYRAPAYRAPVQPAYRTGRDYGYGDYRVVPTGYRYSY
jgi:osmotically inducible lipoprotein OsmB